MMIFFFLVIFGQLMRHPLVKLFHLSNLLQMPYHCRMVHVEFFDSFSCSFKRFSFKYGSQFIILKLIMASQYALHLQGSNLLCKTLWTTTALYSSLSVPGPKALLMLWVVSSPLLYNPFSTCIRKLLEFAFCLTSFPWSKINIK